jgi:RNA polymerase sigma factor (sigma-70 family)
VDEEAHILRDYVTHRSPGAFARLVDRYVDLVYSAALRQVGDAALASDVSQAVFLILSQKAATLRADRPLSAWLLRVTQYCAANARRERVRRKIHERRAAMIAPGATDDSERWAALSPLLDEGMSRLRAKDRNILLLRFFERKTNAQVARSLGISEGAAEKRVTRAVEKLRDFFRRRGVAVSVGALTSSLATRSAEAAPAGLNGAISSGSATSTMAAAIAKGTVMTMAATKAQTIVITALAMLLLIGGGVVVCMTTSTGGLAGASGRCAPPRAPCVGADPIAFSRGPSCARRRQTLFRALPRRTCRRSFADDV